MLLSLALREQLGLLIWCVCFQASQPRPACECSKERPLLESLSLGIQQRGKRRANTGRDPRALHMNNCKWEKDAPRDRVGGKLWQWLITPKAGRAGDYLTTQHASGIGWTPSPSEILKDFVQSTSKWHLQMKTELFSFPALNKLHFQQHLAKVSASASLSLYLLSQTESSHHFSFQSTMERSDPVDRGQSLCLQPQIGLH